MDDNHNRPISRDDLLFTIEMAQHGGGEFADVLEGTLVRVVPFDEAIEVGLGVGRVPLAVLRCRCRLAECRERTWSRWPPRYGTGPNIGVFEVHCCFLIISIRIGRRPQILRSSSPQNRSRTFRRKTLPTVLRGSSDQTSTRFGAFMPPRCSLQ